MGHTEFSQALRLYLTIKPSDSISLEVMKVVKCVLHSSRAETQMTKVYILLRFYASVGNTVMAGQYFSCIHNKAILVV
jgi:hypothetical protein